MATDAIVTADAVYYDGRTNRKRSVTLQSGDALHIIEQGTLVDVWPCHEVRRADGPPGVLRLSCIAALPLARLEVTDAAMTEAVTAHCRLLDVGRGGSGQAWRIAAWSIAAVCSILVLTFYGIPLLADRLAPYVPAALERRIGEAVDKQVKFIFSGRECTNAEGLAAFATLVDKLKTAGQMEMPFDAHVLSSSVPNAFALPGGKIYMLDGLIQRAQNADELAGVLAHELGHVRHRDNMRRLIQTGGTSFLLGLLFGDVTGAGAVIFVARSMFDASYSRDAERAADAFTVEVMHKLGRSPKPMGELLFRVTGAQGNKSLTIFAGHPLTEDRLATMTQQDRGNTGPELLTPREWRALKTVCRSS